MVVIAMLRAYHGMYHGLHKILSIGEGGLSGESAIEQANRCQDGGVSCQN